VDKYAARLKKLPQASRKVIREMRDKFRKPLVLTPEQQKLETEEEIRKEIYSLEVRLGMVEKVIQQLGGLPSPTSWQEARNILLMRSRQKELKRLWSYQVLVLKKKLPDQSS
jgi:hypothetical protein